MLNRPLTWAAAALAGTVLTASTAFAACTSGQVLQPAASTPALPGRVVYHTYMGYGDGTSNLYIYDFSAKTNVKLNSASWNISDPMNAQFSPDGSKLVFMGKQGGNWNVFVWTVGSASAPLNLTAAIGGRNEDPRFTADGKRIVLKHEGDVGYGTLAFSGGTVVGVSAWQQATSNGWATEESMPAPTPSGKYLLYTIGSTNSSIYRLNTQTNQVQQLTTTPAGAHDYYPVVRDYSTYFFTRGVPGNGTDQLMMVMPNVSGNTATALSVNDCNSNTSDIAPVDEDYVIFSSGKYDPPYGLMIGELASGKVWRLSQTLVNVSDGRQKLGSHYTAARP
jgi:Tol biopolymer transport system component